MSFKPTLFLTFLLLSFSVFAVAQNAVPKKTEYKQPRILILLDASSSMLENWGAGKNRFKEAGDIILNLMDSIYKFDDKIEFALRVYGHEHVAQENNCFDSKREVIFSKNNYTQMSLRLASLQPLGVSPIAYSLKMAAENDLVSERDYAYSIILITDGGESCNGSICDVVKDLLDRKIEFKPFVVSLADYAPLREVYKCLGTVLDATNPKLAPVAVTTIAENFRQLLSIPIVKPAENQPPVITKAAPKVEVQPVKVPEREKPKAEIVDALPALRMGRLAIPKTPPRLLSFKKAISSIVLPEKEAEPPVADNINPLRKTAPRQLPTSPIPPPATRKLSIQPIPMPSREAPPPPVAEMSRTRTASMRKLAADLHAFPLSGKIKVPLIPMPSRDDPPPPVVEMSRLRTPSLKPIHRDNPGIVLSKKLPVASVPMPSREEPPPPIVSMNTVHRSSFKILPAATPNTKLVKRFLIPAIPMPSHEDEPRVVVKENLSNLQTRSFHLLLQWNPKIELSINKKLIAKITLPAKDETPETFKLIRLKPYSFDRINYQLFWSTATPRKRVIAAVTLPRPENAIAKTPPAKPKDDQKAAVFTSKVEPSQQTLLEVYFTDGKGKFFSSTPPIELFDPQTGNSIKKFFRTTDANGNPDPQNVPAGTYHLVIGKKGTYIAKNVAVLADNRTRVTIVVSKGSLSFAYENNEARPVNEFVATVKKNFEPGPTITQKCTAELEYDDGNYHVEVNTLPTRRYTVDLDFGVNTKLFVEEPGFVNFSNPDNQDRVSLYYPLGDEYVKFFIADLSKEEGGKHLRIQPGPYEAHIRKFPKAISDQEEIIKFTVKSNETTEVTLKK